MIAIIDYGMGNLRSVQKGFEKVGFEAVVTSDPRVVLEADKVVLPGVGAFRDCMRNLEQGGFVEPILRVVREGRPFLGICLGLQLLFTESEEFGIHKGLGVIPGRVVHFPGGMAENGEELKVPENARQSADQIAQDIAQLPEGDRPARFDLRPSTPDWTVCHLLNDIPKTLRSAQRPRTTARRLNTDAVPRCSE